MRHSYLSKITIMLFIIIISASGVYAQQFNGFPPTGANGTISDLAQQQVSGDSTGDNQSQQRNPGDINGVKHMQPPPSGGLCTDGTYLFVMTGNRIHQYTVSDMALINTIELPKPELPTTE
ncbi:MAG: hypothetical protein HQK62_06270 [Desulfamplus sp.]|nr:hypothetical protein [Desulfamplus sp.]